jgi:DNA-packaging protein gp3
MSSNTIQAGKDPSTGRFTTGNRWWEARSSHGPNPKFETASDLQDACLQYFEWNESNPLYKDQLVTFQGTATHEPVAQMRAMTIAALCMFIGVDVTTWRDWHKTRPDLSPILIWAESVIYRQKFEGASADLLNSNIIARDLGLADKKELSGANGGAIETKDVSATEVARRLAFILASAVEETKP